MLKYRVNTLWHFLCNRLYFINVRSSERVIHNQWFCQWFHNNELFFQILCYRKDLNWFIWHDPCESKFEYILPLDQKYHYPWISYEFWHHFQACGNWKLVTTLWVLFPPWLFTVWNEHCGKFTYLTTNWHESHRTVWLYSKNFPFWIWRVSKLKKPKAKNLKDKTNITGCPVL